MQCYVPLFWKQFPRNSVGLTPKKVCVGLGCIFPSISFFHIYFLKKLKMFVCPSPPVLLKKKSGAQQSLWGGMDWGRCSFVYVSFITPTFQ